METKKTLKALRLVCGAAKVVNENEIDPEYIPQIKLARAELAMMRGTDVVDALLLSQRTGLSLDIDVRQRMTITSEKSERRSGR